MEEGFAWPDANITNTDFMKTSNNKAIDVIARKYRIFFIHTKRSIFANTYHCSARTSSAKILSCILRLLYGSPAAKYNCPTSQETKAGNDIFIYMVMDKFYNRMGYLFGRGDTAF